ncbi:MAG: precorrin-6Y C5,15-methyltransferase (decarboxylating) subunit CbiT, partial [Acidimicrobiales bacterium]
RVDLAGLAGGAFPALSVVVLWPPTPGSGAGGSGGARSAGAGSGGAGGSGGPGAGMGLAWGLPDGSFAHRRGLITKAEVRAVALGKLALPAAGVLWDVGAGSGSVSVECDRLAPGLDVYAVDRPPAGSRGGGDDLEANTAGTGVRVVWGSAPEVLATLPDPDRVFVGGGGLDVLDAVLGRLRPGGVVVATYAAMDRAAAAASRLGQVVQVSVSRGVPVGPDGALRLAALNPVFVCWGPG